MSPRSAAILACRSIALFLGINAVIAIVSFLLLTRELGGSGPFWAFVGPTLVIAYVLWVFADQIAEPMARGTGETAPAIHRLVDLQAVAFSVVGVVLVVQAIPELISVLVLDVPNLRSGPLSGFPLGGFPFPYRGAAILGAVVQITLGVALVLGSRRLAEWLVLRNPEPETELPPAGGA